MTWEHFKCTTSRLRPVELLSRDFDSIVTQIHNGSFQILWVDMVPQNRFAPSTKFEAVWNRFRVLLQAALRSNMTCFVAGVRKTAWDHPLVDKLVKDNLLFFSTHRWCHFGITMSPGASTPSSVMIRMMCNVKLPNHSCKCPGGQEHCFDIDSSQPGRAQMRGKAENQFSIAFLTALGVGQGSEIPTDLCQDLAINVERQAFPTEQKIAQKQKSKAPIGEKSKSKKKRQNVEQHHDDCGQSLAGLEVPALSLAEFVGDESEDDERHHALTATLHQFAVFGGYGSYHPGKPEPMSYHVKAKDLHEAMMVLGQMPAVDPKLDIVELCGGEGLTTYLSHRRKLKTGANFELVTGVDLTQRDAQEMVLKYLHFTKPRVVVMAPICNPFGPLGGRNRVLHPETWEKSFMYASELAAFCGQIALNQLEEGRHFLCEQPFPSKLYEVAPWPHVRQHCLRVVFDQCTVGQHIRGVPVKKPTELVATHHILLKRFANHICQNDHQHQQLLGGLAKYAQRWTRKMCDMIAASIDELAKHEQWKGKETRAYPTIGTGTEEKPEGADQPFWRKCKGCLWRLRKHSPEHTRVEGECKYSAVEPIVFECPSCKRDRPRSHPGHTLGPDCRHSVTGERASAPKTSIREKRAPRAARIPAVEDPTANIRPEEEERQNEPSSASSSRPNQAGAEDASVPEERLGDAIVPANRNEDRIVERQPRSVEMDTQTPVISDWTKFDLQSSLRELISGTEAQKRRMVRKLHLRWWHCGTTTLARLLKAAGAPADVLDMVPEVVDTCRICRAWAKPSTSMTSNRLITEFNQEVECDIVFSKHQGRQKMFLHLVDRAVRWCSTTELEDKSTEKLLDAIDTCWVAIFGPMKTIIIDGELGLDNESSTWYFQVRGINKRTAAVGQHPRIADRRVQILRSSIHKISSQLSEEGIAMPFKRILAEATFVINTISSVAGVSPYVAVRGRSPALMPELGPRDPVNDDRNDACPIQHAAKIRELAVQTITEQTARERLRVAAKTPTRVTGDELGLKVGDEVEYYREPTHKDLSGWRGPATVVDLTRLEHGRVGIRTSTDQVLNCRTQDVRHRLAYLAEFEAPKSSYAGKAQSHLQQALESITHGSNLCLGQVQNTDGTWQESTHNTRYRAVLQSSIYVAEVIFQIQDVAAVRIAKGVKSLGPKPEYTHSLTIWWTTPADSNIRYLESQDTRIIVSNLAGENWDQVRLVQFLRIAQKAACVDNWAQQPDNNAARAASGEEQDIQSLPDRLSTIPEGSEPTDPSPTMHEAGSNSNEAIAVAQQYFGNCVTHKHAEYDHLLEASLTFTVYEENNSGRITDTPIEPPEVCVPAWTDVYHLVEQTEDISTITRQIGEQAFEHAPIDKDDRFLDCDEQGIYVAIEIHWPYTKAVEGLTCEPRQEDIVELRCYESHVRKAVIDRQDDLMTADEIKQNAEDCYKAMLRELQTWLELKCFQRRQRADAPCIIDTRWVFRWKYVDGVRTIRARLTLRGFRETGADDQSNFSATASKWSQRLIISEIVQRGWHIASTDISKAFLQGVSYDEIASETGQPMRDVSFEVCPKTAHVVRQLPGYQDFSPSLEVLHCLKPGTGCRDAPRAFSIQLRKATRSFGLVSSLVDSELEYLWEDGELKLMVLKHVDDLKIGGNPDMIKKFVAHLAEKFGKLQIQWNEFVFCGIQHKQDLTSHEITRDQTKFVGSIKPMLQQEIATKQGDEKMPEEMRRHFLSLLMTIAYAVQTRPDIAVYIAALQKESQEATHEAARRLNKVLLWAQKNPQKIRYRRLEKYPDCLMLISDSAFKAREQDGLSMRGMLAVRVAFADLKKEGPIECHLLHAQSKTQRHVTRSTFASELFAATDALDYGLLQVLSLEELIMGPMTWTQARNLQTGGEVELTTQTALAVDAKSVTAAAIAPVLRAPAENSALVSVAWLREQLKRKTLNALFWSDTRTMAADGLTKGSINRQGLHEIMDGTWTLTVKLEQQLPKS